MTSDLTGDVSPDLSPDLSPDVNTVRLDGRLLAPTGVVADGCVVLDGARVAYAGARRDLPAHLGGAATPPGWPTGRTLLPGLVDVHCHGGAGGEFGGDTAGARRAAEHHHRAGTTTLVASIASRLPDDLVAAVGACAALAADGTVAGIHLEGPFLSSARCGAQNPAALRDVDPALLAAVAGTADGALLQMTWAPERDPAGTLPDALAAHDVLAALGHTDCDAATATAALAHARAVAPRGGRPLVTHVFNGMPPLHHRSPGPVAAALAAAGRSEAVLEVIGDGVHLADETVRMLFDTVGPESICLVTDAMAAAGMDDGRYALGGLDVDVHDGVARLAGGSSIAGGTATLLQVVRWCVTQAGVPLADAVTAATVTPSRALGLRAGTLETGGPGDVLVVDDALSPVAVYRAGTLLG